jgi:chromate reductase, NAD(P)H dehydrogenase (quinone)
MKPKSPWKIVALGGSVRPGSATMHAVQMVADTLRASGLAEVTVVDPARMSLPLPEATAEPDDVMHMITLVSSADAVILATPEYHGSYSSVIKLLIDHLGYPSALKGKPAALLGVAAGQPGATKALRHLADVCRHVGAEVLPGSVSLARVHQVFDADGRCNDPATEARLCSLAEMLLDRLGNEDALHGLEETA